CGIYFFQNPMSLLSSGFLILWMTVIYLFTLTSPQTCMKRCLIHRKLVNAQPLLLWSHEAVNKTFKSDPRDTARNLHGRPMDLRKETSAASLAGWKNTTVNRLASR